MIIVVADVVRKDASPEVCSARLLRVSATARELSVWMYVSRRWNRNPPRPQPQTFSKLVVLRYIS